MITLVVDRKQNKVGYIISNKFFPSNFIDSIVSSPLPISSTKLCTKFGRMITVDSSVYSLEEDFLDLLRGVSFSSSLNDISFIKRFPSDSELSCLSEYWKEFSIKYRHTYTVIDKELNILGYFITDEDIYESGNCYLCMLEVLDKDRGIGTSIVKKLVSITSIRGLSCIKARTFWLRNGAVFSNGDYFKIPINI